MGKNPKLYIASGEEVLQEVASFFSSFDVCVLIFFKNKIYIKIIYEID
jgi:hypothetical protein